MGKVVVGLGVAVSVNHIPVGMIMGALAVGAYLLLDRRSPPLLSVEMALMIAMMIWISLTMIWAQVSSSAWEKWDWAFKTLAFATFIPFVIRSRIQIEAFAQTYVISLAANFVPFGLKTLVSGGGYGSTGRRRSAFDRLFDGDPAGIYLSKHGQLIPRTKLLPFDYWFIAGLALVTAIGTYERSALMGILVLGMYMWMRSKRKLGFGIVVLIAKCLMIYTTSCAWNERIATIGNFEQENSALTRILVWRWTLEFSTTHPFGGRFRHS